jgi:riboflavin-specific deaminase-like protein
LLRNADAETDEPTGGPEGVGRGLGRELRAQGDGRAAALHDIFSPFVNGGARRPFVVAQLGQSLDGRIATVSGESKYINGEAALRHLHEVRARVDAVVVGVGTVVADDPQLTVRLTHGRHPVRVVLDPKGRAPHGARCFRDGAVETLVVNAPGAAPPPAGVGALTLAAQDGRIDPCAVVEALAARGLRSILVEGGARTISAFIDAGVVDRLHVLVAPMIIGSGQPGLELAPVARLCQALRPSTSVHVLADGDVLFDCDLAGARAALASGLAGARAALASGLAAAAE